MEIFAAAIGVWVLCALPFAVLVGRASRLCARHEHESRQQKLDHGRVAR